MKDLRSIIAKNISELRTEMKMTQLQLAEVLNYSDKAVSKWERAEAVPDIVVLKAIADYFGVTVDYLLEAEHKERIQPAERIVKLRRRNRLIITFMSMALVWLIACIAFAVIISTKAEFAPWLVYIYAIPVCSVVALVFNCIWGKRKLNFLIVTFLAWGTILSVYLTVLLTSALNLWALFIVGAPIQVILFFLPGLSFVKFKDIERTEEQ